MWTLFFDNVFGGDHLPAQHVAIEAPRLQAEALIYRRFREHPALLSEQFGQWGCGVEVVGEGEDLAHLTAHQRGVEILPDGTEVPVGREYLLAFLQEAKPFGGGPRELYAKTPPPKFPALSLDEYIERGLVMVIRAEEIRPEEAAPLSADELEEIEEENDEGYKWMYE